MQIGASASCAAFVASNVCYELLFSDAQDVIFSINYVYFSLGAYTFAASVSVIGISCAINYYLSELDSEEKKTLFCSEIRYMKQHVFVLSITALFTWMASIVFMAQTKYTKEGSQSYINHTYLSSVCGYLFGGFGCCLFIHMQINMKLISDRILDNHPLSVSNSSSNNNSNCNKSCADMLSLILPSFSIFTVSISPTCICCASEVPVSAPLEPNPKSNPNPALSR